LSAHILPVACDSLLPLSTGDFGLRAWCGSTSKNPCNFEETGAMTISPQRWLGALAVSGAMALPIVSLAQDGQNDRDNDSRQNESRQSDSDRDRSDDGDRDRDRSQSNDPDRDRNRDENRSRQNDDRDWADNSSNQDDDQAGLGVTLYERESGREGATIRRVHPNSPAEHMGLRAGDRITKINGDEVESYRDLIKEVRDLEAGDNVRIEIQRDGDEKTVRGELESRREALVFRGQGQRDRGQFFNRRGNDGRWNQERERVANYGDQSNRQQFSYEGGSSDNSQHQHVRQQLDSLERQVNQLRREIDQLRNSVSGRESGRSQGYTSSQDQSRNDSSGSYERESQAGYSDSGVQQQYGSRTSYDAIDSPGGQVGEERLRPNSDVND
jgi:hypothetical protein